MPLLTKFLYTKRDLHWETLKECIYDDKGHEHGYTGANYYEEQKRWMNVMLIPDEAISWC